MRYYFGVLLPIVVQLLVGTVIVVSNQGNGSFIGLGVVLLGMFAVPATLITNVILVRRAQEGELTNAVAKCWGTALLAPFFVVFLLFLG